MPLNVLLILVVVGITVTGLLLHVLGKSRRLLLTTEDARSAWHRHFPEDEIHTVTVTQDQHAALVQTTQSAGLLWAFGADTVGRHLLDFDLIEKPDGLTVIFHDFTAPRVYLQLSPTERPRWQEMMMPS
jgi:hypothetical protein